MVHDKSVRTRRAGSPGHRRRREEIMSAAHRPLTLWLGRHAGVDRRAPGPDSERRPVIVVVLHNYAAIAPPILEHAAREVDRTVAQLGIGVRWMARR